MSRRNVPTVINWREKIAGLKQFMERMPFKVPLEVEVGSLAAGERQKAEIVKQLYLERKFLVLDEPTSVLTPQEAIEMLGLIRGLAHSGALTIVIIAHKLKEVAAFVDEVTVLRRGRMAGTGAVKDLGPADLTAMMIGEPQAPKNPERKSKPSGETRLAVSALRTAEDSGRKGLSIDLIEVHANEIVGIAGVSGNGQKDLVEVLGGQRAMESGRIMVDGAPYDASREQSQAHDVRVLPEEPLRNSCVPPMTVVDNLNLRSFDLGAKKVRRSWLDRTGMALRAKEMIAAYGIRAPSPQAPIGVLSGGNVQRCVLARELDGDVRLLIVANPASGWM